MGSVALCYLIGFVVGNTPGVPVDSKLAMDLSTASVALAIPLLEAVARSKRVDNRV